MEENVVNDSNLPCWCGSGIKLKKCHKQMPDASEPLKEEMTPEKREQEAIFYRKKHGILLKTPDQIVGIRRACRTAAEILDQLCRAAQPGVTTQELDELAVKLHKERNAVAAPLGYGSPPFPKSICTSLNEVICHGIPDKRPLVKGDIMNIDVTAIVDGFYGDCSRMVIIGDETTADCRRVVQAAYDCLMNAIAILKPGLPINAIGSEIERVAEKANCSVVYQFVGHGVGVGFHEAPQIFHCYNKVTTPLAPGMTFTIEPMINLGKPDAVIDRRDQWTARTIDGKESAQWEHTILITDEGYDILTLTD
jgi:methionyl aminopeptidase